VFWRAALATGDPVTIPAENAAYRGKRVNPARLFEAIARR
jgi:hypothetical protein